MTKWSTNQANKDEPQYLSSILRQNNDNDGHFHFDSYDHAPYYCAHFGYRQNDQSNHAKKLTTVHLKMITSFCESQMLTSDGYFIVVVQISGSHAQKCFRKSWDFLM